MASLALIRDQIGSEQMLTAFKNRRRTHGSYFVPNAHLLTEDILEYRRDTLRLLEMWGLEDEKIEVIEESFCKDKSREFARIDEAMRDFYHFIIVEPPEICEVLTRWIVVGNFVHEVTLYTAYSTILLSLIWPQYKWLYWPPFLLCSFTIFVYNHNWSRDPCCNYQFLTNEFTYARFPMHRLDSGKAKVFVLEKNDGKKLHQKIIFGIALVRLIYYLIFPAPPCLCDWRALRVVRDDKMEEVRNSYTIPWYLKYLHPYFEYDKEPPAPLRHK